MSSLSSSSNTATNAADADSNGGGRVRQHEERTREMAPPEAVGTFRRSMQSSFISKFTGQRCQLQPVEHKVQRVAAEESVAATLQTHPKVQMHPLLQRNAMSPSNGSKNSLLNMLAKKHNEAVQRAMEEDAAGELQAKSGEAESGNKAEPEKIDRSIQQSEGAKGEEAVSPSASSAPESPEVQTNISPTGEADKDVQTKPKGPNRTRADPSPVRVRSTGSENAAVQMDGKEDIAQQSETEEANGNAVSTKNKYVQAKGQQQSGTPALESDLKSSKGAGTPMADADRGFFESRMGADFSNVRIHTGSQAVQLNEGLGAKAFAHGSDIYFNANQYQPGTSTGKHLLAHELTHTVQQGGASLRKSEERESESGGNAAPGLQASCASCASQEASVQKSEDETAAPKIQAKCATCEAEDAAAPKLSRTPNSNSELNLQRMLKIGQPGDQYEQEADATADRVMGGTQGDLAPQMVQGSGMVMKQDAPPGLPQSDSLPPAASAKPQETDRESAGVEGNAPVPEKQDLGNAPTGQDSPATGQAVGKEADGNPQNEAPKVAGAPSGKGDKERNAVPQPAEEAPSIAEIPAVISQMGNERERLSAEQRWGALEESANLTRESAEAIYQSRQQEVMACFQLVREETDHRWHSFYSSVVERIIALESSVLAQLEAFIESVRDTIAEILNLGVERVRELAGRIEQVIQDALDTIEEKLEAIGEQVANIVNGIPLPDVPILGDIRNWIAGLIRDATGLAKRGFSALSGPLKGLLSAIRRVIEQVVETVRDAVSGMVNQVTQGLVRILSDIRRFLRELMQALVDKVSDFLGNHWFPALARLESKALDTVTELYSTALAQIAANMEEGANLFRKIIRPDRSEWTPPNCSQPQQPADRIRLMEMVSEHIVARNLKILEDFAHASALVVQSVCERISHLLEEMLNGLESLPRLLYSSLSAALSQIISEIRSFGSKVWQELRNLLVEVGNEIARLALEVSSWVLQVLRDLLEWAANFAVEVYNYATGYIRGILQSIGSFLGITSGTPRYPSGWSLSLPITPLLGIVSGISAIILGLGSRMLLSVLALLSLLSILVLAILTVVRIIFLLAIGLLLAVLVVAIAIAVIALILYLLSTKRRFRRRVRGPTPLPVPIPSPAPGPCPPDENRPIAPSGQWGPDFYAYSSQPMAAGGQGVWIDYLTNCAEEGRRAMDSQEDFRYVNILVDAQANNYLRRGDAISKRFRSVIYDMDISALHYRAHTPIPAEAITSRSLSILGPDCGDPTGGDPGGGPEEEEALRKCDRGELPPEVCRDLRRRIIERFGNKGRDLNVDPDADVDRGSPRPEDGPISESYRRVFNRLDSWVVHVTQEHPEWKDEFNGGRLRAIDRKNAFASNLRVRNEEYKRIFRDFNTSNAAKDRERAQFGTFIATQEAEIADLNRQIAVWYKGKTGIEGTPDEITERIHQSATELWRELWEQKIFEVNRVFARLWPPAKANMLSWIARERGSHPGVDLEGTIGHLDYVGSLAKGVKGPPKQHVRFNPMDFDVDANFFAPPMVKHITLFQGGEPDKQKYFSRTVNLPPVKDFVDQSQTELSRIEGFTQRELFDVAIWAPENESQRRVRASTVRLYHLRSSLSSGDFISLRTQLSDANLLLSGQEGLRVKSPMSEAEFQAFNRICDGFESSSSGGGPQQDGNGSPQGTGGGGSSDQEEGQRRSVP